MGVDLKGLSSDLHLGWPAWSYCLDVAVAFGWQPEGTQPTTWHNEDGSLCEEMNSKNPNWKGGYMTNDYQFVTDSDAKALTAALDRAIGALAAGARLSGKQSMALGGREDQQPLWSKTSEDIFAKLFDATVHKPSFSYDAQLLGTLAGFAREGGFCIG